MAMLRIGTSGWHYTHWVGPFYPADTEAKDFLPYYAARFDTVEVNSTFYGLPSEETVTTWRDRTPEEFVFACKASRYITHLKKLKDPDASTERFLVAGTLMPTASTGFLPDCHRTIAMLSSSVTRRGSTTLSMMSCAGTARP